MKRFLVVGVLGGLLMLPLLVNKMAAICLTTTDNGLLPVGVQPLVSDILKEWRAGSIVSRKEVLVLTVVFAQCLFLRMCLGA